MSVEALCLGETMVLVTPKHAAPLRCAETFVLRAGGAESNVAMFLADLGHRVAWASRLGEDPLGHVVLDAVGSTGVDTSLVEVATGEKTGVYFKDPAPEGTSVHYYRAGSAASRMTPAFLSHLPREGVRVIHVSGITAGLSESCAALMDTLVIDRAFGDALVSFDVNYRQQLWPRDRAAPALLRLAQAADIVFVGLDEATHLWGTNTPEEVRREVGTASSLIVKDGSKAAYEFDDSAVERVAALQVQVVEPIGAGDAFAAGWLSGWLRELPAKSRLRLGHLMAAVALSSTSDHGRGPGEEALHEALALADEQWAAHVPLADGSPRA